MVTGCFSWCPSKRGISGGASKEKDVCISDNDDKRASVVPATLEYAMESGKETLKVLKSAANLIPVPFLQEAIQVALKVLELCEVRQ